MSIYQDHPRFEPSQLYRELTGLLSLSPFDRHNSSSRKQMWASHIGQTLVTKGTTERRNQTGMEDEYGKYTFDVRMPCDAEIIRVIPRYQRTMDQDSIQSSPETLVIYENVEDRTVGCLSLPQFYSHHQHFGFRYRPTAALKNIYRRGAFIAKDTILLNSPNVDDNGRYKFGVEANVAFMSHPATSEDGILISKSFLPKLAINTIETRVVEFGSRQFPKNLFGGPNGDYKPFLDIGELVPDHGKIAAFGSYEEDFAAVEQSVSAVKQVDSIFDTAVYASPGGRITDIQVWHDEESVPPSTLTGMDAQMLKYDRGRHAFYEHIKTELDRLHRERGDSLSLTPELHRLSVETISVVQPNRKPEKNQPRERVTKAHRGVPLDDWRIKFTIEYETTPTVGFKLTDGQGGKGVICKVAEEHEMPIDADGNRADIVMDPGATVSRMNLGRLYEQYINGASRDLTKWLREVLDINQTQLDLGVKIRIDDIKNHPRLSEACERLLRYYEVVSPYMGYWFGRGNPPEDFTSRYSKSIEEHVVSVLQDGITLYMPPETPIHPPTMISILEKEFPSTYGPVTYVGNSGKTRVTKRNVRIASFYVILLEKTGDDWTAVSSGKLQNFGVHGQINNRDKYAQPTRTQAIRAWGETEIRIVQAYAGPIAAAELLDRNNSIQTHAQMLEAIYEARQPTNIESAVNRRENPLGSARPLQLMKHFFFCGGIELAYRPFDPTMGGGLTEHESGATD